jgi:hypothetical protein
MSWDLFIFNIPDSISVMDQLPIDYSPPVLGKRIEILNSIKEHLVEVDFRDPTWGIYQTDSFRIEIDIGEDEDCSGIMIHVRGTNEAMSVVEGLLNHLSLRGVDMQTGNFFNLASAKESLSKFNGFKESYLQSKQLETEQEHH